MSNTNYDDFDRWQDDGYEDDSCSLCGGEGYAECNDWIQCMRRHVGSGPYQMCPCAGCGGTGLAKDQTIW